MDLTIVVVLQLIALIYGATMIYQQRPSVIAFAGDRFEVIPSSHFNRDTFNSPLFSDKQLTYPLLTYALPAQTKEEKSKFLLENVIYQKMSERYRPLDPYIPLLKEKSLDFDKLIAQTEQDKKKLNTFKQKHQQQLPLLLLFILEGTTHDAAIIAIHSEDGHFVDYLDVNPWKLYQTRS